MNTIDHWPRVEHGLRWIDRADDVADRFVERRRAEVRTNKKTKTGPLRLGHRTINDRQRRHFVDGVKSHAHHDADNLRHDVAFFVVSSVDRETFTDRVLTREKLFRHCLIDDDHAR